MKFVELNERFYSELIVTSNCFAKKDLPISSAKLERYEICLWLSVFIFYFVLNFLQFSMCVAAFESFPFLTYVLSGGKKC